ncbi:MAG TPA: hypothetical protein VNZ57_08555 [Longimicrobiales bacterium]|nr:hypothetical protein [Longimicrobiales bacterium]
MKHLRWLSVLAAATAVTAAACDRGANPEPQTELPAAEAGAMDNDILALIIEMQEIEQTLGPLHTQALEDEGLSRQLESIQGTVESALREADPALLARADQLQARLIAAQEAGDLATFQTLAAEAQSVHDSIQVLQTEILERPEIRTSIEEFEAAHRARVIELDPSAKALLDRADAIMAELEHHLGH